MVISASFLDLKTPLIPKFFTSFLCFWCRSVEFFQNNVKTFAITVKFRKILSDLARDQGKFKLRIAAVSWFFKHGFLTFQKLSLPFLKRCFLSKQ